MNSGRRVIGTEHIHRAHARGQNRFELLPGDIITDLARESAHSLAITLLEGPVAKPPIPRADSATSMQRQLLRRSPKWVSPTVKPRSQAQRIEKIALVGAGGVGATVAHLCALKNLAKQICLVDIIPGIAAATALDLEHSSGITGSHASIEGGDTLDALEDADVVVVTAGKPRTPGMSRNDLLALNRRVIESCAEAIKNLCPNAIVIVVTNPVDEMTHAMLQATGFVREKVLGMAGTLDSSRFRVALSKAARCNAADVSAITLGSHGDEMVPLRSMAKIKGRALETALSEEQIQECIARAVRGGGDVVALRKTGSATLAPAHSVVEVLEHICEHRSGWVPVSVKLSGEYGLQDVVMGVPVHLGPSGMIGVEEFRLTTQETEALHAASASSALRQSSI